MGFTCDTPHTCEHCRTQKVGTNLHNILGQGVDPGAEPPGHGDAVLGVGDLVLVLLGGQHEVVVDGAGLDGVYQVDEGEAGGDGLVLEPGDGGPLPSLPQLVVGPLGMNMTSIPSSQ